MGVDRVMALGLALASGLAWGAEGQQVFAQGGANPAAPACVSCHGAKGEGMDAAGFPRIAGQSVAYLTKQLNDFRAGTRNNPVMQPVAKALSAEEIAAVAPVISALPNPEPPLVGRDHVPASAGEKLALRGAWDRGVPECVSCHGPSGVGVGDTFPRLAGQGAQYIANALHEWRSGGRHNDPEQLMVHIAKALTEDEITAVAAYFSSLGNTPEGAK